MAAPRIGRRGWVAVVAVAAGGLAAWAAHTYLQQRAARLEAQLLQQQQQQADMQAKAQTTTVARLVAVHDLAAGTRLHADLVAIRDLPADYAASDTLAPERFGELDGAVLAQPLARGDPIVAAHLARVAEAFSNQLDAGRRAVTIPVDELNAFSGLLEPGDEVDLLVSFEHRGRWLTTALLQGVRVLATGRLSEAEAAAGRPLDRALERGAARGNERNFEHHRYTAITLELAADDAVKLVMARQTGRITALLRHRDDSGDEALRSAAHDELAAWLGAANAAPVWQPEPGSQTPADAVLVDAAPVDEARSKAHSEAPQTAASAATVAPAVPVAPPGVPVVIPVIYGDQPVQRVPDLIPLPVHDGTTAHSGRTLP